MCTNITAYVACHLHMCTIVYACTTVSFENVLTDIGDLEKGMELTHREFDLRKDPPSLLKDFYNNADDKMKKLKVDSKAAQVCCIPEYCDAHKFDVCVLHIGYRF